MVWVFGAWLDPIPAGAKHLLGVIENAHRQDDEAFLMVHVERCLHTLAFIERAQRWQDTWNYLRPHFGYGMGGRTPLERLRSSGSLLADRILGFPVLLLEGVMRPLGSFVSYLNRFKDVQYVRTKCPRIPGRCMGKDISESVCPVKSSHPLPP